MTIWKSVLITTLLIIISTALGLVLMHSFSNDLEIYKITVGLSYIIPNLLTYALLIIYLRSSKDKYSLTPDTTKIKTSILIFLIFTLAIGDKLFDLPFFEWKSLSNKYFGSTYIITDYSNYKFETIQLWRGASVLILAPFFEEIVFRYYIFGGLLKKYNFLTAMVTSSILFSLIHIDSPKNLIPTFVFGLICSIVYFQTKKIYITISLHLISNCIWFATIVFAKEYDQLTRQIGLGGLFWFIFMIGIFILTFGLKRITTANIK